MHVTAQVQGEALSNCSASQDPNDTSLLVPAFQSTLWG